MTDAVVPGNRDIAAVDIFFADQDAQQGGFTVAVAAHQADLFPGVQGEADTVEENMATIAFFNILDTDHKLSAVAEIVSFLNRVALEMRDDYPGRPACGYYI